MIYFPDLFLLIKHEVKRIVKKYADAFFDPAEVRELMCYVMVILALSFYFVIAGTGFVHSHNPELTTINRSKQGLDRKC